ncbi:MAG: ParB N-terminal domain-containing protein [Clostridia bacterium]|nr:ParB N-terminal domain-containing protein [Clostridia bacterium]
MAENLENYDLILDSEFMKLSCPLSRKEYTELEDSLLEKGCIEPIVVWNNTVIDGHKRYTICKKYQIPFSIKIRAFESRASVIAWICYQQLGKTELTEEFKSILLEFNMMQKKPLIVKKA